MRNWHKGRNGAKTVFVLWVCLFSPCSYQVSREKTWLTVYCFPLLLVVCACVCMSVSDLIWHEGLADWSQPLVFFTLPACRGPSDSCCLAVLGFITKNDTIVWYSFWRNQHLRHDIPHCISNYKLEFRYGIKDKVKGSQIWRVGRPTFTCIQLPLCYNYNFERSPSDAEERQHLNESLAVAVWPWRVDLSCTTLLMSKKMLCIFWARAPDSLLQSFRLQLLLLQTLHPVFITGDDPQGRFAVKEPCREGY